MKVVALRGVCIGPGHHLVAGETADMDTAMYTFLAGIKAVEKVEEPAAVAEDAATSTPQTGSEAGKEELQGEGAESEAGKGLEKQTTSETGEGSGARKSGKKEK